MRTLVGTCARARLHKRRHTHTHIALSLSPSVITVWDNIQGRHNGRDKSKKREVRGTISTWQPYSTFMAITTHVAEEPLEVPGAIIPWAGRRHTGPDRHSDSSKIQKRDP